MPDHTLRVPDATYQAIKELAGEEMTMQAVVVEAVETLRRERFWKEFNAEYAALRADPVAWAEELAERAAWDGTLMDGLEPAVWTAADFVDGKAPEEAGRAPSVAR